MQYFSLYFVLPKNENMGRDTFFVAILDFFIPKHARAKARQKHIAYQNICPFGIVISIN